MIQKIVNNFYLRNIVLLLVFLSPEIFQSLAIYHGVNKQDFFPRIYGYTAFYLYFIFHNRVLYEKFLAKKKYLLYIILFPATIFVWREGTSYLIWLATKPPTETVYKIQELERFNAVFWFFVYWADFVYIYFCLGIYLAFKYFNERTRILQAENVQKELELKQLNEQLNPHFLFNALNNIYSHELRSSPDTKELILKLSELMRYILDSSKKNTVSLKDEIKFTEHYIAFEKERLGDRCTIDYRKDIDVYHFNIVPLILFNIIENAFKYGTTSAQHSEITIDIRADSETLQLYAANNIYKGFTTSTQTGLNNTRRRLDLLYKDNYKLDVKQTDNKYETWLKIGNIS